MAANLSIYIENTAISAGAERYTLKAEDIALQVARTPFNGSGTARTYYVPTQYQLLTASMEWVHRQGAQYVYILHSNYNGSAAATQYFDKYECAIQQFRCNLSGGTESRWEYTLQFVLNKRIGDGTTDGNGVGAKNT